MKSVIRSLGLSLLASISCMTASGAFAGESAQSVGPLLRQPSMNVFRRYAADPEKMFEFYGPVLGLEQLQTYSVGGGQQVARFQLGDSADSQIKLTKRVPNKEYRPGRVEDATGLRLLALTFPDEQAVVQRFREHGFAAPEFRSVSGSERRVALVTDPDGQYVELDVVPNAELSVYKTLEVGLTVSDIERSRSFYRDFAGLEELPPADDPLFHTKKYPFRHGTTVVSLRSFGAGLPADTGSGGIQYVVHDIEKVDALAKARQLVIDQPLGELRGFQLRTIWLQDPDGITNYFAETAQSRQAAQ
ncbi:MAG TPA: VOC family protein [Gammaproteobacteria bacterium]|nr:VOC family protein [Gammaproteobacteria bacterium]